MQTNTRRLMTVFLCISDISIGDSTVRKSDDNWVPFFILIIVLLFGIFVYLLVQKVNKHIR